MQFANFETATQKPFCILYGALPSYVRFDGLVISNRIVRDAEFLREVGSSPKIVALCAKKVRVGTWRAIAPMDGWK